MVHYLLISQDMRGKELVNKYLRALHETDDSIEAARQTFGDLQKFQDGFNAYIHRYAFLVQRLQLTTKLSEKDFPARALSPAEGLLAQVDYLLRSNHLPEGLELLHEVEKMDAVKPSYHSEFGYYHYVKSDYVNTEKELQLSIAGNPNDFAAHLFLANMYYRRDGYTATSTPKIRAELEKVLSLNPEFVPAYAFLSVVYAQEPDKNTDKALKAAMRASELEPGNLAYYVDIGRVLLAAGRIPEAKKIAETAQKTTSTPADRTLATNFMRQIEYRVAHPKAAADEKSVQEDPTGHEPAADSASATDPVHAEGQITELLCGRPPEVLLTLSSGEKSLLLHVSDIGKISIQSGAKASDIAATPCAKWKDRMVQVDYRPTSSGVAQGEVQIISLQ